MRKKSRDINGSFSNYSFDFVLIATVISLLLLTAQVLGVVVYPLPDPAIHVCSDPRY